MVAVTLLSCAGRTARQAQIKEMQMQQFYQQAPRGERCTAPAVGACSDCTVQCTLDQRPICRPGESRGERCVTEASCRCAPAQ